MPAGSVGVMVVKAADLVAESARLAERFVAPLGRRWAHVQSVARAAETLSETVDETDRPVLVAAAWLHDIGYAPDLATTRFHPLDGARYLRDEGWPGRLVNLVTHHSGARFEAAERGLEADRRRKRKGNRDGLVLKVPQWSLPMWRQRKLASCGGPLFPSFTGNWLDPSNVINAISTAMDDVGYGW